MQLSQLRGNHLNAFANVSPRALAVRRRSAIRRKRKGFPKGKGKQPERVSLRQLCCLFSHLVRLCIFSPQSESMRPPRRRKLMIEIEYISPKAKAIAKRQVLFVGSPSCRAGTYFRCTTKVGKDVPKREENRSGRFSSLLGTSHLSTDRGSPPSLKRLGLTYTVSLGGSRAVWAVEI